MNVDDGSDRLDQTSRPNDGRVPSSLKTDITLSNRIQVSAFFSKSFKELRASTGDEGTGGALSVAGIWGNCAAAARRLLNFNNTVGVRTKNSFLAFSKEVSGCSGPDLRTVANSPDMLVPWLPVIEGVVGLVELDA